MKSTKKEDGQIKKKVRTDDAIKLSGKVLKSDSEHLHVQYPARVGYHGTDEERQLSPEE